MYSSRKVKQGRKEYTCAWCLETILTTEPHFYRAYTFDGQFMTDRLHEECSDAMYNHPDRRQLNDEGFIPGEFARGSFDEYERPCYTEFNQP